MKTISRNISQILAKSWLPWVAFGLMAATFGVSQGSRMVQAASLPTSTRVILWGTVVIFCAAIVWAILQAYQVDRERRQLRTEVDEANKMVAEAYERLEAIFHVSHKFVQANDEDEVIQLVLKLAIDLVGATGASFVPLDERGQPSSAISSGKMPFPVMTDWVEYLASPAVRERCYTCEAHGRLETSSTCPLLQGPFSDSIGMFCLPLRHGDRNFGVLNLFLPRINRLDAQTEAFVHALLDETALALEGVRLRRREVETLRQMQSLRQKADLTALLKELLENLHQTLKSGFSTLSVEQPGNYLSKIQLTLGDFPVQSKAFLDEIIQRVMASGEPVLLSEVEGKRAFTTDIRSVAAIPLLSGSQNTSLGVLMVGNHRTDSFQPRHLTLLETAANQIALVIQNANIMAELEYSVMIQERTRLAREIHDGLAQTLGFLKLQMAQMKNYLARDELERLSQSVELSYMTLSEAYQDARQAIDGLRIWPKDGGLRGWLEQTVTEFKEASGLPVELEVIGTEAELPSEVHAQLIRIVQEALSNIRKHANAMHVWIASRLVNGDLWIEVRDDGIGFSSTEVPSYSRHGLRGMRERSELIGADFQIISLEGEGTTVRVRLPMADIPVGDVPA